MYTEPIPHGQNLQILLIQNTVIKWYLSLEEVIQLGLEPMTSELCPNFLKMTFSCLIFYLDSTDHKIARTVVSLIELVL